MGGGEAVYNLLMTNRFFDLVLWTDSFLVLRVPGLAYLYCLEKQSTVKGKHSRP